MDIPKKIMDHLKFVKFMLVKSGQNKCTYCKYYWLNYKFEETHIEFKKWIKSHCDNCTSSLFYRRIKGEKQQAKYHWFRDEFLPLYDWETED